MTTRKARGSKIGRPKKFASHGMLNMRVPTETLEALDAWVEELRASTPGGSAISRSDLIRDLLAKAVAGRGKRRR